MLRPDGEIHVSHKNKPPFCHWKLEELASKCSLVLKQCVVFDKSQYPGYENKRGDGSRCDQPFILGDCSTFKFRFSPVAKEYYAEKLKRRETKERESKSQAFSDRHPLSFDLLYPQLQGVSQSPVSLDLSCHQDHNLRQVQHLLLRSRHRTSPLDFSYHHEHRCQHALERPVSFARFQGYSIQRDRLMFTERSSFQFQARSHHYEQFLECSSRFDGVSHDIYNGEQQRMLPRCTGESLGRHRLLSQDFPVQAIQEPFFERSNHFNGVPHETYNWEIERMLTRTTFPHPEQFLECSNRFNGVSRGIYYGEEGRMSTCTSFHHPYLGESSERSLATQSNFNIYPPQHW